jgi:hypothetical protein
MLLYYGIVDGGAVKVARFMRAVMSLNPGAVLAAKATRVYLGTCSRRFDSRRRD